jgi:hypothetical protein
MYVFFKRNDFGYLSIITIHVDDILLVTQDDTEVGFLSSILVNRHYGELEFSSDNLSYLGMEINRVRDGSLLVTQTGYARKILERCDYTFMHVTPSKSDLFDSVDSSDIDHSQYKSQLMSLMFLAIRTRPDILKEVVHLSSFSINPGPIAFQKLHRIFGYIRATVDFGIRLKFTDPTLVVYCDASFAVHVNGRSHSGIYVTVGECGGPILVKSHAQRSVSHSSTEAELICLVDAVKRVLPIQDIIRECGIPFHPCIKILEDNKPCIKIAEDGEGHAGKRKFFRLRYHFLKELLSDGQIEINHCPTQDMLADLLTKPIGGERFRYLRAAILNLIQ